MHGVKLSRTHRRNDSSDNDAIGELCLAISEGTQQMPYLFFREKNNSLDLLIHPRMIHR